MMASSAGLELERSAASAMVAAVWQGALLAGAACIAMRLLPRASAAVRFTIWFGVFGVVALLPAMTFWPGRGSVASTGGHGAWLTLDPRWCLLLVGVWAAASLARAIELAVAAVRVRGLWKRAQPVADAALPWQDGRSARPRAVRRAQLCLSSEVDRPTVIGFLHPRILMPEWLLERLSGEELEQIILHESGHLRRADDWLNLVQKLALVASPLNPALSWVERRLCFERELACDERVLAATGAPRAYATCLATLAELRLARRRGAMALALGALGRVTQLERRVRTILTHREETSPARGRMALGVAMVLLLVAGGAMLRCPALVGFSEPAADTASVALMPAGVHAEPVVLRTAAAPRPWRTTGDAAPQVARPVQKGQAQRAGWRTPRRARMFLVSQPDRRPVRVRLAAADEEPGTTVLVVRTVTRSWETTDGSRVVWTRMETVPVQSEWLMLQL